MAKKALVMAFAAVVSLLAIASLAAAQGMWRNSINAKNVQTNFQGMGMMHGGITGGMMNGIGMMHHHGEMEELMEGGTYSDLLNLREEYGFKIMPWIENEEDFNLAQKMHERMEKYYEANGTQAIGRGHCPMTG